MGIKLRRGYIYGAGRGIPLFSQDTTKAFSGYHPEKGNLQGSAEKKVSPVKKTDGKGFSRARLVQEMRDSGPPKSTNWRTSRKPIKR